MTERDIRPTTTISIVSHGQGTLVARLLADIERHWDTHDLSVIVTVNVPETLPFDERRFAFPVLVVRNDRPRGFGANHNRAFKLSCADLFCVLNPDIRAPRDPLPALRRQLLRRRRLGLVAPRILGPEGAVEDSARRVLTPGRILRRVLRRRREPDYPLAERRPLCPDWVAGMFMLVRARAFAEVGGFDERYFMYCEDADLCVRLWHSGHGVELVPAGRVVHAARRASHTSIKHLYWHITSLLRFFLTAGRRTGYAG